jgi:hypothetical protein
MGMHVDLLVAAARIRTTAILPQVYEDLHFIGTTFIDVDRTPQIFLLA